MRRDATGMTLCGRRPDGRFVYSVLGTGWNFHEIALTHDQRVVFAKLRRLVDRVRPGTILYPANLRSCYGRGEIEGYHMWLPVDVKLSRSTCETIAHEFVHNEGLTHGSNPRGYSLKWREREAYWIVALSNATSNFTKWPKVKGLRKPPVRKPKAVPSPEERREARRAAREKRQRELLAVWEKKLALAKAKVAKYRRSVRAYNRAAEKRSGAIAAKTKEANRG